MSSRVGSSGGYSNALERNEFLLHYQPVVDSVTEEIVSFEALVRWNHPTRGMVSPADFIPLAEDTGLITQLGEWVLKEACRIASNWPDHLRIAVNLSPRQLRGHAFGPVLIDALTQTGLKADRLELEVTESVLLTDSEDVLESDVGHGGR